MFYRCFFCLTHPPHRRLRKLGYYIIIERGSGAIKGTPYKYVLEPQAVAVSPYGWLMTHYGWLAG